MPLLEAAGLVYGRRPESTEPRDESPRVYRSETKKTPNRAESGVIDATIDQRCSRTGHRSVTFTCMPRRPGLGDEAVIDIYTSRDGPLTVAQRYGCSSQVVAAILQRHNYRRLTAALPNPRRSRQRLSDLERTSSLNRELPGVRHHGLRPSLVRLDDAGRAHPLAHVLDLRAPGD
jgi:hypothetical protein